MSNILSAKELRREADFRRLKSRYPICLICAYRAHPAAIEFAHIIPRAFGLGCGIPLCSNCHRELTDQEKDMSFKPTTNQPDLETVGRFLSALGEHYEKTAPTLKHLGAVALEQARLSERGIPENGADKIKDSVERDHQ